MKIAALATLVLPLVLTACATQPSAQVLDAHARRNVNGCVANAWLHDGIVPGSTVPGPLSGSERDRWLRRGHWPGVYPIPGPADISDIERKCR